MQIRWRPTRGRSSSSLNCSEYHKQYKLDDRCEYPTNLMFQPNVKSILTISTISLQSLIRPLTLPLVIMLDFAVCVSPGEWCKFHIGAVVAAEKDAGNIVGTWGGVLCVCGEWWWLFGASPHSQAACSVLRAPPVDFSSVPPLEWALMESWRGSAHLRAEIGLPSLSVGNKIQVKANNLVRVREPVIWMWHHGLKWLPLSLPR